MSSPTRRPTPMLVPAVLLLAGAIVLLAAVRWGQREIRFRQTRHDVQQAAMRLSDINGDGAVLAALSRAQRDLATFVQPSVVHVDAQRAVRDHPLAPVSMTQTGSGWVWDSQGHIITAWHVIDGAGVIDVQMANGTRRRATVIGADPLTDVAVLEISPERLIPATRTDELDLRQGDLVFAFGSPLDFRFSVTSGVVSGLGRATGTTGMARQPGFENFIQIDAPINPGSSGGPITDHQGYVIGMSTAIATDSVAAQARFSGVALAIPLDMIESVVPQLIASGGVRRGLLGVTVLDLDRAMGAARSLGATVAGAMIVRIVPDSSMQAAGVEPGDIIKGCAGKAVRTADSFRRAWHEHPGGPLSLDILRPAAGGYRIESITVDHGGTIEANASLASMQDPLHVMLTPMGAPARGVYIDGVAPDGPSHLAGLQPGDLIVSIAGRPTTTVDQLRSVVSSTRPGVSVEVQFWRKGTEGIQAVHVELTTRSEPTTG